MRLEPYTIGASSVPAILGLDPWDSAYALGARLLDGRDNPSSEAAQMGLDLEAAHAELVAQAGYEVMPAPVAGFVHPELPWLCVHPDGLIGWPLTTPDDVRRDGERTPSARIPEIQAPVNGSPTPSDSLPRAASGVVSGIGPLELKLRGVAPSEAIRMRDTVQSLVQVHAMGATQGLVSTIAGGFGGIRRTEFVVTADDEAFGMIRERLERFLDQLRRGVLPEPDGHDATRDAIRARFAHAEPGKAIRATQEAWGWVKRIRELREVENTAKEQRQAFEHRVQDFMGDATELVSPYDTPAARWRPVERTSIDTTRLKRDRPEIAGEYAKTTTSRRFEANV